MSASPPPSRPPKGSKVLVVGAGLSGATLAHRFKRDGLREVVVIDKREHLGGNCYDFVEPETGILMGKYGAHILHTDNERVWKYLQQFAEWERYDHRVLAAVDGKLVPVPVNMNTINALDVKAGLKTEEDTEAWFRANTPQHKWWDAEADGAAAAIARVGERLYEKIFKHYTKKQWDKYPHELDASVTKRIPRRTNTDDRYFGNRYQALPVGGYTAMIAKMLDGVELRLNTPWDPAFKAEFDTIVFTGPIDVYFDGVLPKLEYRTIDFKAEIHRNVGYVLPAPVVNYPGPDVPYTRKVEYKHFGHQASPHSVVVSETTRDDGDPYYPVPSPRNHELYAKYQRLAEAEEANGVHFVGRLANYKYLNMDEAIDAALRIYDERFAPLVPASE